MSNIERQNFVVGNELEQPLTIVSGCPEELIGVIQAGLALKNEIDMRDTAAVTMPGSIVPRRDSLNHRAGDVSVAVTDLPYTNAVMYEIDLSPDIRPVSYGFVFTLQAVREGIRLHKESSNSVIVDRTEEFDETDPLAHRRLTGAQALRAQEIILTRAARQLKDERIRKSAK